MSAAAGAQESASAAAASFKEETKEESKEESKEVAAKYKCITCQISLVSKKNYDKHRKTASHKRKEQELRDLEQQEKEKQEKLALAAEVESKQASQVQAMTWDKCKSKFPLSQSLIEVLAWFRGEIQD